MNSTAHQTRGDRHCQRAYEILKEISGFPPKISIFSWTFRDYLYVKRCVKQPARAAAKIRGQLYFNPRHEFSAPRKKNMSYIACTCSLGDHMNKINMAGRRGARPADQPARAALNQVSVFYVYKDKIRK